MRSKPATVSVVSIYFPGHLSTTLGKLCEDRHIQLDLQQPVMATFLPLSTVSSSTEKSEEEEVQEERVAPRTWRDIPAELKAMMLCSDCALPAYDAENPVVLACAHILCMKCLTQKWNSMTPTAKAEQKLECPRCATKMSVPKEGIRGFPGDTFTRSLKNSILQTQIRLGTTVPRCGLHPEERLSNYCQQCQTQVCKLCMNGNHTEHELESLKVTAQRLDNELMKCIRPYLDCTAAQISDTLQTLEAERLKMKRDFQQLLEDHKTIRDTARDKVTQDQAKVQEITGKREQTVENLEAVQKPLENPKLSSKPLQRVKPVVVSVKDGQETKMRCLDAACQDQETTVKKAERNIEKLEKMQQDAMVKFMEATDKVKAMKKSVDANQSFANILHTEGNDSDKVSRIPGIRDKMLHRKLYSGRQIEVETLVWESDMCQANEVEKLLGQAKGKLFDAIHLRETLLESLEGDEGSLLQNLQHQEHVCTIPVPCERVCHVIPVQLFAQHYILHAYMGINSDKICVHDTTGAIRQLIPVPGARVCGSAAVLDSGTGLIVVSDQIRVWTEEMLQGNSTTHLRGKLHWLALSKTFTVTSHEVKRLECVQRGHTNVDHAGHLLVITHCTTGKHPKQLHVYDKHQHLLCRVNLPSGMHNPSSALTSATDIFVVVCWYGVCWIDHQGQVLPHYGQQPGELSLAAHIVQHSKGPLLITDWANHRLVLLGNEATPLQHLSDVEYPNTLHLDEQEGLLFVAQWRNENNVDVKVTAV